MARFEGQAAAREHRALVHAARSGRDSGRDRDGPLVKKGRPSSRLGTEVDRVMSTHEQTEECRLSSSQGGEPATSRTRPGGTLTETGPPAWSLRHLPFLAMATVWLSAVYAVSHGRTMEVSTVGLGMLLLGVPMCLAGICASTLRRHRWLSALFRQRGRLYLLLSGRWLSVPLWTIWGLGISFLLLLQFHVYEPVEWAVAAATIPLFTILFAFSNRSLLKAGVHSDMAVTGALVVSRWTCPAVLLGLQMAAMVRWGDLPQHVSIEAAVAAHTPEAADRSGSALVREALHWAGYFDGLKAYALTHLGPTDALGAGLLLVLALGNYALLYFTCLALSCFRIPRAGFVRARLAPRSTEDVFIVGAVAAFLIPFIYFPALAQLESIVSQSEPTRVRAKVQATITPVVRLVVEQIDDDYYLEGTRELIA
ncbi:MAG: hypothetical protein OXK79_11795, partial [Chloroflexota bacterium]|nr:hypothetical protein [Chloroflexota bacterium]